SACHPQAIHSALLARKSQKPALRRWRWVEPTSQDAATVTAIAGHCTASRSSFIVAIGGPELARGKANTGSTDRAARATRGSSRNAPRPRRYARIGTAVL